MREPVNAIVTAIEPVRFGSRATSVALDGEPWRITSKAVIARLGLAEGDVIEPESLSGAIDALEPELARERALASLTRAETSRARLLAKLADDGYAGATAAVVVERLAAAGLVDDARYADMLASSMSGARGYGRARVARELARRGIEPDVAGAAVDAACPPEDERERAVATARRLASAARGSVERLGRRLVARGFSPAMAFDAARRALGSTCEHVAHLDAP